MTRPTPLARSCSQLRPPNAKHLPSHPIET